MKFQEIIKSKGKHPLVESTVNAGKLSITSGKIIACDPLAYTDKPTEFKITIKKGNYPVTLFFNKGCLRGIALAELRISNNEIDHWIPAIIKGQVLKKGELPGYGVDAGMGCFADIESFELLQKRENQLSEEDEDFSSYYDNVIEDEMDESDDDRFLNHVPYPKKKNNVIMFNSGDGDGYYTSYWGLDKNNEPVCLVTDFQVIKQK